MEDDAGAGQSPGGHWPPADPEVPPPPQDAGPSIGEHRDGLFATPQGVTAGLKSATSLAWEVADGANLCPVCPDRALTEPRDQRGKKI